MLHQLPIIHTKLEFAVRQLFTFGSPVALFLTLRGARSGPVAEAQRSAILVPNLRIFNIYHSLDPIAYRLEPLVVAAPEPCAVHVPHYALPSRRVLKRAIESVTRQVNPLLNTISAVSARGAAMWASWRSSSLKVQPHNRPRTQRAARTSQRFTGPPGWRRPCP